VPVTVGHNPSVPTFFFPSLLIPSSFFFQKILVLTLGSPPEKGEKKKPVLSLGRPPKKGGKKKKKTLVLTLGSPPKKDEKKKKKTNAGSTIENACGRFRHRKRSAERLPTDTPTD
jgi:hypothetical protein